MNFTIYHCLKLSSYSLKISLPVVIEMSSVTTPTVGVGSSVVPSSSMISTTAIEGSKVMLALGKKMLPVKLNCSVSSTRESSITVMFKHCLADWSIWGFKLMSISSKSTPAPALYNTKRASLLSCDLSHKERRRGAQEIRSPFPASPLNCQNSTQIFELFHTPHAFEVWWCWTISSLPAMEELLCLVRYWLDQLSMHEHNNITHFVLDHPAATARTRPRPLP